MPILTRKIEDFYELMPKSEFEYHIHISTQNSYIYFEVPKVACSTTKLTLQKLEAKTAGLASPSQEMSIIHNKKKSLLLSPSDIGIDKFCKMLNDSYVFKFGFVRNPYTRILSAFLSKMKWKEGPYRKKIAHILNVDIKSNITFKQFVYAVSRQSEFEMDPHWRPQTTQLFRNLITYDFIGFFENFEQDLQEALKHIALNKDNKNHLSNRDTERINMKGRKTSANNKIESFYAPEIQSLVKDIYQNDFINFGYSFDLPV
ncbi:MAG: sulfotransferase family protein [Xenococcaceae cyanobacterium MO_188.B29]|nr:sulfotransferase family protein [Xenococcaceae cyanobacterium MO_188.B29]